jgi:hypothetical protein
MNSSYCLGMITFQPGGKVNSTGPDFAFVTADGHDVSGKRRCLGGSNQFLGTEIIANRIMPQIKVVRSFAAAKLAATSSMAALGTYQ